MSIQFGDKFAAGPYRDRLLSELEDHKEDAQEHFMLQGISESQASERATLQLGDERDIAREYNKFVQQQNPFFFWMRVIFFGLGAFFLMAAQQKMATVLYLFSAPVQNLPELARASLAIAALGAFVFLTSHIFFRRQLIRLLSETEDKKVARKFIVGELLIAFALYGIIIFNLAYNFGFSFYSQKGELSAFLPLYFIQVTLPMIGAAFSIGQAYRAYLRGALPKIKTPSRAGSSQLVHIALSASASVVIIGFTALQSLQTQIPSEGLFFQFIQIIGVIYMMSVFFFFVMNGSITSIWLLGLLLTLIGGLQVYRVVIWLRARGKSANTGVVARKTYFPWSTVPITLYVITTLAFGSTGKPDVTWHQPTREISQSIEMRELGPFYHLGKMLNQSEGQLFRYSISREGDGFLIKQSPTGQSYLLTGITSATDWKLSKYKTADNGVPHLDAADFTRSTETLYCEKGNTETPELNKARCGALLHKKQRVYTISDSSPYGFQIGYPIKTITSANGRFLLIHLSSGVYNPTYVYLVDLGADQAHAARTEK